jgi:hypothetical protein
MPIIGRDVGRRYRQIARTEKAGGLARTPRRGGFPVYNPGPDAAMKHRKILAALLFILVLLAASYLGRGDLIRLYIANRIRRSHTFIPPPLLTTESAWSRHQDHAEFYWDFAGFILARQERVKKFEPILKPLVAEIDRRQSAGEGMQYSMHIYREIRWRLNFTPDEAATRARIDDLRQSLNQPELQSLTKEQQPDGSWALGINVWFLKLYYSVDETLLADTDQPNAGKAARAMPKYRLAFLDRVSAPEGLTGQLNSALYDDFTRTGTFNREELDETFSALARLMFHEDKLGAALPPLPRDALLQFVMNWQNPATGCWGQWLIDRNGRTWKMDDVGMTFHVVADLHGQVPHLDRIAKRVLALDAVDFPNGVRFNGHYENHLDWDVVRIFRYAWPYLDEPTRAQIRAEISRMLDWCLRQSLQPDGSFKLSELDDTVGDAYSYGVWFLQDAGYFRREDRFWTDQDFPDAKSVHDRIQAKINSIGLSDSGIRDADQALKATQ